MRAGAHLDPPSGARRIHPATGQRRDRSGGRGTRASRGSAESSRPVTPRFRPPRPSGIMWARSHERHASSSGSGPTMPSAIAPLVLLFVSASPGAGTIDLARAMVVAGAHDAPVAEKTAVTVLVEEAEKRTGIRWPVGAEPPRSGAIIVATSKLDDVAGGIEAPEAVRKGAAGLKSEGFV